MRLRYAAVRALELWGGRPAIELLQGHVEPEAWLADYARRVQRDLAGEAF